MRIKKVMGWVLIGASSIFTCLIGLSTARQALGIVCFKKTVENFIIGTALMVLVTAVLFIIHLFIQDSNP